jgi:hypothetical protein
MQILLGVRENGRIEAVAEETMVVITLETTTQRTSPVETSQGIGHHQTSFNRTRGLIIREIQTARVSAAMGRISITTKEGNPSGPSVEIFIRASAQNLLARDAVSMVMCMMTAGLRFQDPSLRTRHDKQVL